MSGGGGNTTTVQKSDPPAWAIPYIQGAAQKGMAATNAGYEQYPGQRVAPLPQETLSAISNMSQGSDAAAQQALKTINGDYLSADTNPYLKANVDQALGQVRGQVNSQFNNNNYGGSAHEEWLQQKLADTALPMYNQNYQQERARQLNAMISLPQVYKPQLDAGNILQTQEQNANDTAYEEWMRKNGYGLQQAQAQAGLLNSLMGGQGAQQTTQPGGRPNKVGNAAAGASAGFTVGGPWGAAIGGALGYFA